MGPILALCADYRKSVCSSPEVWTGPAAGASSPDQRPVLRQSPLLPSVNSLYSFSGNISPFRRVHTVGPTTQVGFTQEAPCIGLGHMEGTIHWFGFTLEAPILMLGCAHIGGARPQIGFTLEALCLALQQVSGATRDASNVKWASALRLDEAS